MDKNKEERPEEADEDVQADLKEVEKTGFPEDLELNKFLGCGG